MFRGELGYETLFQRFRRFASRSTQSSGIDLNQISGCDSGLLAWEVRGPIRIAIQRSSLAQGAYGD